MTRRRGLPSAPLVEDDDLARARNIKPRFFTDAELVECDFWVRLLFAGLWTLADRRGILADEPKQIKMDVFPSDAVDVEAGLSELAARGLIDRYEAQDGTRCIHVVNFLKHQNPHKDEKSNGLPEKPGASTVPTPGQHGANPAESLNTDSLVTDSLIADTGLPTYRAGEPRAARAKATTIPDDWQPTPALRAYAVEWGIPDEFVGEVVREFVAYWQQSKGRKIDWGMTFQNRVRDVAPQYARRAQRANPNGRYEGKSFTELAREGNSHDAGRSGHGAGHDPRALLANTQGGGERPGVDAADVGGGLFGPAVEAAYRVGSG